MNRIIAFIRFGAGMAVVFSAYFLASAVSPGLSLHGINLPYRVVLLLLMVCGLSVLNWGVDRVPGNPLAAMGLGLRGPWLRDVWIGALLGAGMIAVCVTMIAVRGNYVLQLHDQPDTFARVLATLLALAIVAFTEELGFRGYPFQRLIEAVGPRLALLTTSVLFGAMHLWNPYITIWGFINTVLIGMLLGLAYLRTGSLWMPVALHFCWNATLGLVFGLPVSGVRSFAAIGRGIADGPLWLTGDGYGMEGSDMATIIVAVGAAVLVCCVPPRERKVSTAAAARIEPTPEAPRQQPATPADHSAECYLESPDSNARPQ